MRQIEGTVSVSVPWTGARTGVSSASPPRAFSPSPSGSVTPASSAAPVSAAGTDSWPAWSSAGPKEKERIEKDSR